VDVAMIHLLRNWGHIEHQIHFLDSVERKSLQSTLDARKKKQQQQQHQQKQQSGIVVIK
jgi:hypothetical protein